MSSVADTTVYDVSLRRLDEQMQRIDSLDSKAATVFGFAAALLPVFGALFSLLDKHLPRSAVALYIIALVIYCALVFVTWCAYRNEGWSLRPDLPTLQANSKKYDDTTMRQWVADECISSIASNEPQLRRKALYAGAALVLLATDALLLSAAALVVLW